MPDAAACRSSVVVRQVGGRDLQGGDAVRDEGVDARGVPGGAQDVDADGGGVVEHLDEPRGGQVDAGQQVQGVLRAEVLTERRPSRPVERVHVPQLELHRVRAGGLGQVDELLGQLDGPVVVVADLRDDEGRVAAAHVVATDAEGVVAVHRDRGEVAVLVEEGDVVDGTGEVPPDLGRRSAEGGRRPRCSSPPGTAGRGRRQQYVPPTGWLWSCCNVDLDRPCLEAMNTGVVSASLSAPPSEIRRRFAGAVDHVPLLDEHGHLAAIAVNRNDAFRVGRPRRGQRPPGLRDRRDRQQPQRQPRAGPGADRPAAGRRRRLRQVPAAQHGRAVPRRRLRRRRRGPRRAVHARPAGPVPAPARGAVRGVRPLPRRRHRRRCARPGTRRASPRSTRYGMPALQGGLGRPHQPRPARGHARHPASR